MRAQCIQKSGGKLCVQKNRQNSTTTSGGVGEGTFSLGGGDFAQLSLIMHFPNLWQKATGGKGAVAWKWLGDNWEQLLAEADGEEIKSDEKT